MTIEINFLEKDIEDYLCEPDNLMKHFNLRFVARQVEIFGFRIDILAYNEAEKSFYIIELKKDILDAKAFTQVYKYYKLMNVKYNYNKKNNYHNFKMLLIGQHLSSELVGVLNNYSRYSEPSSCALLYSLFNYDFDSGISFSWYSKEEREFSNNLREYINA